MVPNRVMHHIAIKRCKNHASIVSISSLVTRKGNYYQGVRFLRNTKKASQNASIPARIIKENSDLFAHFILKDYNDRLIIILKDYNDRLIKREFPQTLNIVNVTPVQKKD